MRFPARPPTLRLEVIMSRRTRAWQLLMGASLLLGCNGSGCNPPASTDPIVDKKCGAHTMCPFGYECRYEDGVDPKDPNSLGLCKYVECQLTEPCKESQPSEKDCALPTETLMCDKFDRDHYCSCVRPSSQDVPGTPTTGVPTPGDKP